MNKNVKIIRAPIIFNIVNFFGKYNIFLIIIFNKATAINHKLL